MLLMYNSISFLLITYGMWLKQPIMVVNVSASFWFHNCSTRQSCNNKSIVNIEYTSSMVCCRSCCANDSRACAEQCSAARRVATSRLRFSTQTVYEQLNHFPQYYLVPLYFALLSILQFLLAWIYCAERGVMQYKELFHLMRKLHC